MKSHLYRKWLPNISGPFIKAVVVFLVLLLSVILIHSTPVRERLEDIHAMSNDIKAFGVWAPAVYVASVALLVSAGLPRLLLCPIGGMVFGFFWGLLWSQTGTMIGYYATFIFVRWSGRDFILKRWPQLNRYKAFFSKRGLFFVLFIRQLPIAGFYINIVLGLTHIRHRNFLLGTLAGILPEAIPATMIGAGIIELSPAKSVAVISVAIILFIIVWTVVARYLNIVKIKLPADVTQPIPTGKDEISA